jgi:hypothetical protein
MGVDGCCVYMTSAIESFTLELTTRFPTSHLMDVMEIYYPQYWLQGDAEENLN